MVHHMCATSGAGGRGTGVPLSQWWGVQGFCVMADCLSLYKKACLLGSSRPEIADRLITALYNIVFFVIIHWCGDRF